ncbi:unnamed protein product [Cochlearia groenlandica]
MDSAAAPASSPTATKLSNRIFQALRIVVEAFRVYNPPLHFTVRLCGIYRLRNVKLANKTYSVGNPSLGESGSVTLCNGEL